MWGLIPGPWDHDLSQNQESDAQPTEPPRDLQIIDFKRNFRFTLIQVIIKNIRTYHKPSLPCCPAYRSLAVYSIKLFKKKVYEGIYEDRSIYTQDINLKIGIPGWRSGLAPAFGPGRDPGDPGSNPTSGSRCMEPASPSACVSVSLSLSVCVTIINK